MNSIVPFIDIKKSYLDIREEIDDAVHRVLCSGWYIHGGECTKFEEEFASYCGAGYCVGVSNGLDALHLVLWAWGIGNGDEVIVPSNTYIATWLAVSYTGATPVPVEPDEDTYNINPSLIESAINGRTKAIIPVHLYGQPTDMDPILEIAKKHNLKVLENSAQAYGAIYKGKNCGSLVNASAFSFNPTKNFGAFGKKFAVSQLKKSKGSG